MALAVLLLFLLVAAWLVARFLWGPPRREAVTASSVRYGMERVPAAEFAIAKAEGRRRAKEAVLEALVEADIPTDARRRVLAKLREVGVI